MKLRDYQQESVRAVYNAWDEHDSCLVVMATGLGKTVVLSQVVADSVFRTGKRWMVIAGRPRDRRAERQNAGSRHKPRRGYRDGGEQEF